MLQAYLSACSRLGDGCTKLRSALDKLKKQCAASSPNDCFAVGQFFEENASSAEARKEALEAFDRACKQGSAQGCIHQAQLSLCDNSSPDLTRQAADLWMSACTHGDSDACCVLASIYERGGILRRDPRKAEQLRLDAKKRGVECETTGPAATAQIVGPSPYCQRLPKTDSKRVVVTIGTIRGAENVPDADAMLRDRRALAGDCFTQWFASHPDDKGGWLSLSLKVDPAGLVTSAEPLPNVASSFSPLPRAPSAALAPAVRDCIAAAYRGQRLAAPSGKDATLTIPIQIRVEL